jgi:tryptophanyl-tRNA synthetase
MALAANRRVLSGMRMTGQLHLGHYHGVLQNWVRLQHEYECFFFVADWHALTTHYESPSSVSESAFDIVADWLAAGVNPGEATLFVQSRVPEHAELHLLLSMITPVSWLERVPSYKDQQELTDRDLSTYGFLGYPLLQAADILIYRAGNVPVGEDQVAHIELAREIARRFNYLYGREDGFEEKAEAAARKLGRKNAKLYFDIRRTYLQDGNQEALEKGRALLEAQQNISIGDRDRLLGYLEGGGKVILPEPQALLTPVSKMPGLNGEKMSKSYGNVIGLRESTESVTQKIRTMPTDPARVRRSDPGDPEKCPVWKFHQIYSNDDLRTWVNEGCRRAGIGCLDCKQPIIDAIERELTPLRERAQSFRDDPDTVRGIIDDGCEHARDVARETLDDVKRAMGIGLR